MEADFKGGQFQAGVIRDVAAVSREFVKYFTAHGSSRDELPNKPVMILRHGGLSKPKRYLTRHPKRSPYAPDCIRVIREGRFASCTVSLRRLVTTNRRNRIACKSASGTPVL
jgi:hypothetical protein